MNCHTYANQDPKLSMMYVRGPGGGAILNRDGKLSKLNIPGSVYFGFSPTGRYITYSTQKIIPAFHSLASKRLEVYDAASNVYVADMQEHRVISSSLLSDSLKFETFGWKENNTKYVLLIGIVALLVLFGIPGIELSVLWYIILSLCTVQRRNA